MILKILLLSLLVGSGALGYFGIQGDSLESVIFGVVCILVAVFTLAFLLKVFMKVFLFILKWVVILLLIGAVIGGIYWFVTGKTPQVPNLTSSSAPSLKEEASPAPSQTKQTKAEPLQEYTIQGIVRDVRSGYFLQLEGSLVKLYGIDSPDPVQKCLDERGNSYDCGAQARLMLERLIRDKHLKCKLTGGDGKGNYIAACKMDNGYDVGAVMVYSGWAIARMPSYLPYQKIAEQKKEGLWAGHFDDPILARKARQQPAPKKKKGWLF